MTQVPTKRITVRIFSPDGNRVVLGGTPGEPQLDITFACALTTRPQRNTGQIRILNLARSTQEQIAMTANTDLGIYGVGSQLAAIPEAADFFLGPVAKATLENGQAYCIVEAGEDAVQARVFEGGIESVLQSKDGAETVTEIELTDGQATAGKEVARAWPAGVRLFDVCNHIVGVMGLASGNFTQAQLLRAIGANIKSVFARPFAAKRSADALLTEIFTLSGAEWWVDRGAFYLVRKGEPLDQPAILLSEERGDLWFAPQPLDKAAVGVALDFRSSLRLGWPVVVDSGGVRTTYRADVVRHNINTRAGDWATDAVLRVPEQQR